MLYLKYRARLSLKKVVLDCLKVFFIPIILSLSFIIINPLSLREFLQRFIIPLELVGLKIKNTSIHLNATMKDNIMLQEENRRLREKNTLLLQRNAKVDNVFLENQRLREILAFKEKRQFGVIVANILGFNPYPYSSTIIIDRGIEDGVKKGFCVVSQFKGKEVFIGRVYNVFPSSSIVVLTTDPGFLIPGRLKKTREKGLLKGEGDKIKLKFIERESPVTIGEPIITIADDFIPPDIIIGYVKDISEDLGLFKDISVRPAMLFSRLEEVLVLALE